MDSKSTIGNDWRENEFSLPLQIDTRPEQLGEILIEVSSTYSDANSATQSYVSSTTAASNALSGKDSLSYSAHSMHHPSSSVRMMLDQSPVDSMSNVNISQENSPIDGGQNANYEKIVAHDEERPLHSEPALVAQTLEFPVTSPSPNRIDQSPTTIDVSESVSTTKCAVDDLVNPENDKMEQGSSSTATGLGSFFKHVTIWFQLKDTNLRLRYRDFYAERESPMFAIFITCTFAFVIILLLGIYVRDANDQNPAMAATIVAILSVATLMILGCFHAYFHFQFISAKKQNDVVKMNKFLNQKIWISTLYCIVVQVFNTSYVSRRASGPVCKYHNDSVLPAFGTLLNYYFCGGQHEESLVPLDGVILLILSPITMASVFPSINVMWIWLQSICSLLIFILVMALNHHAPSVVILVLWSVGSVYLIADLQLSRIKTFLLFLRLNDVIQENARLADEFHSSEMRFLIANVAHDLKTVSGYSKLNCSIPLTLFSL